MGQLRAIESQIDDYGFQILGISPDQPAKLRETMAKHRMKFHLLSDSKMAASRAFGIAYSVDDPTLRLLAQHGIDLEAASGEKHHELPVPAVFIVDAGGVVQFEYINPDYSVRLHPEVLLAVARVSRK